jgi:AAA family ATP:ADP antiporter
MVQKSAMKFSTLLGLAADAEPPEMKILALAFLCNFVLFSSYYILKPLRDTMATVFGVDELQNLFTGTFLITLAGAPVFAWLASRIRLALFLPGIFWFLLLDILVFYALFRAAPQSRWVAASYFWWFSVVNLFLISIFWTFMADIFSASQATRLYPFIAAGGSLGAIAGPAITTSLSGLIGLGGLLLVAAGGFLLIILFVHLLMREKARMAGDAGAIRPAAFDHKLPGNPFQGFRLVLRSPYLVIQVAFVVLMTWISTVLYILQTDFAARMLAGVEGRAAAFADVDLAVNVCSALILFFGLGRLMRRFGLTAGLVLSPMLAAAACIGVVLAPSFLMVQAARVIQRVAQIAIARPSREVLFTVVDQQSKYKAKNVIDTVAYRFGDVTAAWMQAGLRATGFGLFGAVTLGVAVSALWGAVAAMLGRRYEDIRSLEHARVAGAG